MPAWSFSDLWFRRSSLRPWPVGCADRAVSRVRVLDHPADRVFAYAARGSLGDQVDHGFRHFLVHSDVPTLDYQGTPRALHLLPRGHRCVKKILPLDGTSVAKQNPVWLVFAGVGVSAFITPTTVDLALVAARNPTITTAHVFSLFNLAFSVGSLIGTAPQKTPANTLQLLDLYIAASGSDRMYLYRTDRWRPDHLGRGDLARLDCDLHSLSRTDRDHPSCYRHLGRRAAPLALLAEEPGRDRRGGTDCGEDGGRT